MRGSWSAASSVHPLTRSTDDHRQNLHRHPVIVSSSGDLTVGSTIRNVLRDTSGKETAFTPELLATVDGLNQALAARVRPTASGY